MKAWQFLINLNISCQFHSKERKGKATNSELKRWLQNKAIIINGERPNFNDEISFPIRELILFPKKNRITIF
tara:strand:+ start:154 stop:369 length:216 start_codon:yes stop_codon:yes gene_type:complete